MPEYTYLLENRLTPAQQHALKQVREAARESGLTVFLAGGAVRDLTTGSSVRNLDFSVQGNALDLEAALAARGGQVWGVHEPTRTLLFWFPGSVRVQVASARTEEYPKPGKPVYRWSTMVDDLRRRDFTANAMALSLNEGSYGLLLDPLNGVADIEARLLRLASNYGFIEDPSRLVRAARLQSRLGWQMDEKTAARYNNAKESEAIKALTPYLRGYELEKIASEEDALQIVRMLEAEGWMEHLFPAWTSAKADVPGLENLRRNWIQLLMQGVTADLTAAHLELLTAKFDARERDALKKAMVHPGLLRQWEQLEEHAREFGRQLTGKAAATPSATWKMLTTEPAEPILWLAHTRKAGAVDAKFKNFFTVWPEFKKKVPAALMLEMRITPELPGYPELLEQLFFQLIDGNLETDELMRAFLEPYSPPAPPPPPTLRRSRAKKADSKTKRRAVAPDEEDEDESDDEEDGEDASADVDEEEVDEVGLTSTLGKLLDTDVLAGDADMDAGDDAEVDPDPDSDTDTDTDTEREAPVVEVRSSEHEDELPAPAVKAVPPAPARKAGTPAASEKIVAVAPEASPAPAKAAKAAGQEKRHAAPAAPAKAAPAKASAIPAKAAPAIKAPAVSSKSTVPPAAAKQAVKPASAPAPSPVAKKEGKAAAPAPAKKAAPAPAKKAAKSLPPPSPAKGKPAPAKAAKKR